MEKLIELLNEYKETKKILNYDMDWQLEIDNAIYVNYPNIERLCWKQFWFIKRLVENDKIDLKEFHRLCWIINQDSEYWNWTPQEYEQVIMYLSISDTPIEDLVSLLK